MELFGTTLIIIAGLFIGVKIWRRNGEYGVSIPDAGFDDPIFLGAKNPGRAARDAVDLAQASASIPTKEVK